MIVALSRRADFDQLRSNGVRRTSGPIMATVLISHRTGEDPPVIRLAFALPRSFGSAVQRNRARRRCRAVIRELDAHQSFSGSALIRCSPEVASSSIDELRAHVFKVLR